MKTAKDRLEDLVQQGTIVGTMMLIVTKMIYRDYRGKHIGRPFVEWLAAFVLWSEDTALNPKTYTEVAHILNMPPSSLERACNALVAKGLAFRTNDKRYARNIEYLATRLDSEEFRTIRRAIIEAGRALEKIFGNR